MFDGTRDRPVDAAGVRLHVEEHCRAGAGGSPVLVLHGFGGSATAMEPVVAGLAAHHRVLAPDLIGHGRSEAPATEARYGWDAVRAQLVALLDALGVARAHLFGFSLGGRIALQLAARTPDRVRSVVAVGARCAWLDDAERERRRGSDATLATRLAADGAHGLAAALRALGAADQPETDTKALAARGTPVLLVAGDADRGPLAAARALAERLATLRAVAVPEAGHRAHLERTQEVVRLALDFYASADADERTKAQRAHGAAAGEGERRW
jgi:pimeloyl-ACP methyl ester carboxylesterase